MTVRSRLGIAAALFFAAAAVELFFVPIYSEIGGYDFRGPARWFCFGMAALALLLVAPRHGGAE